VKTSTTTHHSASDSFIDKHGQSITGILHGFDRLRLRGTLRTLYHPNVMEAYLQVLHLLWKDFKDFATELTGRIKAATLSLAEKAGRLLYLPSATPAKRPWPRPLREETKWKRTHRHLLQRTLPDLLHAWKQGAQETGIKTRTGQMSALLLLPYPPQVWFHAHETSKLVSFPGPHLSQRSRMAEPANGPAWDGISAQRKLL
jgi:hypothetical protein